eukprot:s7350_g3.t1
MQGPNTHAQTSHSSRRHVYWQVLPQHAFDFEEFGAPPPQAAALGGASEPFIGAVAEEALQTTIRVQNARILALQEELDRALSELSQRETEAQEARQESKQASEEAKRLQKTSTSLEQSQEKLKKQLANLETKAKDLEVERSELTKEGIGKDFFKSSRQTRNSGTQGGFQQMQERDQLDLKLRKAEAECSSKEARLNRLMEESDKWKAAAATANVQDRDRVASDRKEVDRLTGEVRKLERQRGELINAFKKQMKLIEVLKRQRAHMEAARVLSFTEDEFIRILELGEKLGE